MVSVSDIPRSAALLRVGEWPTLDEAHEHALVVLAMGMNCSVHAIHGGYELLTRPDDAGPAKHELDLYASEQKTHHHPRQTDSVDYPAGIAWLFTWALTLTAIFFAQVEHPEITDRFANSTLDMINGHEWWRPFTGLFLHADLIHLAGNILIGGMFCLLVSKSLGASVAWPLILVAGTFGNAIQSALHFPDAFASIGASTATFGALGILVGLAFIETARTGWGFSLRKLSMPLMAGLILFGLLGVSGERTDIGGHAWGGLCGLALGSATGWLRSKSLPAES